MRAFVCGLKKGYIERLSILMGNGGMEVCAQVFNRVQLVHLERGQLCVHDFALKCHRLLLLLLGHLHLMRRC